MICAAFIASRLSDIDILTPALRRTVIKSPNTPSKSFLRHASVVFQRLRGEAGKFLLGHSYILLML